MAAEQVKTIRVEGEVFDLRLDFFFCPNHGVFAPARFDDEWTTESGCPVILGEPHDFCGEQLTAVYLDTLVNFEEATNASQ